MTRMVGTVMFPRLTTGTFWSERFIGAPGRLTIPYRGSGGRPEIALKHSGRADPGSADKGVRKKNTAQLLPREPLRSGGLSSMRLPTASLSCVSLPEARY
jgi:hypothetical protein